MIRTAFAYERPDTIEAAVRLLAATEGSGRVLGGGSVLVPAMSAGEEQPSLIVDVSRLAGLRTIRENGTNVEIGAGVTYAALEASSVVTDRLPLLAAMVREVTGGPGLWNLATLGGAACRANPASDGPGCLVALAAGFRLQSVRGVRIVAAERFFHGAYETERAEDEILTDLILPAASWTTRTAYVKVKHAASSWPIVTASCAFAPGKGVRLCIGAASPVPILTEWAATEWPGADRVHEMAQQAAAAMVTEWADELAGPGYRRAIAATVAARAIRAVTEGMA